MITQATCTRSRLVLWAILLLTGPGLLAQIPYAKRPINPDKFRQLEEELPTPTPYRNAAGAPGHAYWQNRADYDMDIRLDDDRQQLYGTETITYQNASPDALSYLWLQLDQNLFAKTSETSLIQTGSISQGNGRLPYQELQALHQDFDGGFKIEYVQDAAGKALPFTIVKTMMRVDLPQALLPGKTFAFKVKWWYNINDRQKLGGRSGMEYFPADSNYIYTIAQFFPRMCVYNEVYGWQHKQFLGRGEFTLPFGNYTVRLTTPADHVVGATGVLQNADKVLTAEQRRRLEAARTSADPVIIVTQEEATAAEKQRARQEKTWIFKAENVRDFAFASSRKFIWDALGVKSGDRTVLAMSYYPKEGNPLWERYSTRAVAITLRVYSRHTFDYPYPVAISVHTRDIGMEYPMICFNGGRPEPDGTYSAATKYGMISVIIHEVGHNYFPMIVNSDERQWSWMDEGLNTFLQYLTEQEWERGYPSRRGPAYRMTEYMRGVPEGMVPIMTNSESVLQFGNNAYGKPATALNILRETILGRELFDFAFRQYAQRWMFKQPSPADFFRSMEDASGVDLDWFWRGWFYTNDNVDISLDKVAWYQVSTLDPDVEKPLAKAVQEAQPDFIGDTRNETLIAQTLTEQDPRLKDFYNTYDPFAVMPSERVAYQQTLKGLTPTEQALLKSGSQYYELTFRNVGGLVSPLIVAFTYADSSQEVIRIPAEIWRMNADSVTKVFRLPKEVISIQVDPYLETADTDVTNNAWPRQVVPSRFQLYKMNRPEAPNPMQRQQREAEAPAGSRP
ncbi:MAG: M1 family metallopeptidase [Bacteroidia bacterium]|nr:M1 family metallopeptidase [Bacteroidia bacterium]